MKKTKGKSMIIFVVYMLAMLSLQVVDQRAFEIVASISGGLFVLSMLFRTSLTFKPWYTSKYNFLTSKTHYQNEFDLPKDILLDKMKEVLTEAGFKVRNVDRAKGSLFATTPMTFYSWGENIYLDMKEANGVTTVHFLSVCVFGIVSWGKNEKNHDRMLETFENSLTI